MNECDVLCLSAGEQTVRDALCRQHHRSVRRVFEHKEKAVPGFTAKYGLDKLVWFEQHESIVSARFRERQIKEWKRDWKIALIEQENPHWLDLYKNLSP